VAGAQQGAQAHRRTLRFSEESGFSPLPSGVRTSAPMGHTPSLREWWPRAHLSALSARSPEAKRSCAGQDRPINAEEVAALLEPLLRASPGRMVMLWDGAPIHRRHVVQAFLGAGAADRRPGERLPAYAPALNPGEGLWASVKGVERRHICCFKLAHLRAALREAVNRVRQKPRVIRGLFSGAKL
jgi:transposase